jgi:hypothetical protein
MEPKEKVMNLADKLLSENNDRLPTFIELKKILLSVCPNGQFDWDNDRQIIFYTNLTDDENGELWEIG